MVLATLLFFCWTAFGNLAIWVATFNQMHATALSRTTKKLGQKLILVATLAGLGLLGWYCFAAEGNWSHRSPEFLYYLASGYAGACTFVALSVTARRIVLWKIDSRPSALQEDRSQVIHIDRQLGRRPIAGWLAKTLIHVPGNQICQLEIHQKTLRLPNLPDSFPGLTIAHLSDFHLTGRMQREFFEVIIEQTNRLDADMIAITGDIIDKKACLDWLVPLFSELNPGRLGKFYVLGNHDERIRDISYLRDLLSQAGLMGLNGDWHCVSIGNSMIALAGNELPWFAGAEQLDSTHPPFSAGEPAMRILLTHSPDQWQWAIRNRFDLVLAGHTHGGQIRLPWIGPIVSPSYHGVRYASGLFQQQGSVMHVSRGLSGVDPIRIHCRPELTKITLQPNHNRDETVQT